MFKINTFLIQFIWYSSLQNVILQTRQKTYLRVCDIFQGITKPFLPVRGGARTWHLICMFFVLIPVPVCEIVPPAAL